MAKVRTLPHWRSGVAEVGWVYVPRYLLAAVAMWLPTRFGWPILRWLCKEV